jgi:hypothetical protein
LGNNFPSGGNGGAGGVGVILVYGKA